METAETTSTRPYLVRAMYEWCVDNGFTPFLVVSVDSSVRVPQEFVRDGEIVLNVSAGATNQLTMGNAFIEFKGRFSGVARDIVVPLERVSAIYARENGQGMTFPVHAVDRDKAEKPSASAQPAPPPKPRPALTRIK
jgi:stringent starvation protein B